jgi:hypothetical protein
MSDLMALRQALCRQLSFLPEGMARLSIPQRIARIDEMLEDTTC